MADWRKDDYYPKQNSNEAVKEENEQRRISRLEQNQLRDDVLDSIVWYGRVADNLTVLKFFVGIFIFVLLPFVIFARVAIPHLLIASVIYLILRALKIKAENKQEELSQLFRDLSSF